MLFRNQRHKFVDCLKYGTHVEQSYKVMALTFVQ
jgi:hypothetical protein